MSIVFIVCANICLANFATKVSISGIYIATFAVFTLALIIWGILGLILQKRKSSAITITLFGVILHVAGTAYILGSNAPSADLVLQVLSLGIQLLMVYVLCKLSETWP
ncbi:MAG: hypothetical protein AB7H97_21645, partial [Pseudobdellovibrionaceae bacterium]